MRWWRLRTWSESPGQCVEGRAGIVRPTGRRCISEQELEKVVEHATFVVLLLSRLVLNHSYAFSQAHYSGGPVAFAPSRVAAPVSSVGAVSG